MNASVPVTSRMEPWATCHPLTRSRRFGEPAYTSSSMPAARSWTNTAESRFFDDAPHPTAEPTLRVQSNRRSSKVPSTLKHNCMVRENLDDEIEATIKSSRESLILLKKRFSQ